MRASHCVSALGASFSILLGFGSAVGNPGDLVETFEAEIAARSEFPEITTEQLLRIVDTCKLVDTRMTDAYNGWRLEGVRRGGRIPGAVDFSSLWLSVENRRKEAILSEALTAKGILRGSQIVLYDATGTDRLKVAKYLRGKGCENIALYDVSDWAGDTSLPMESYRNYHLLVPPVIVNSLLAGNRPETFSSTGSVKFAEVSWGDEGKSYAKGHVPTSFHIDTDDIEPPPTYMLAGPEVLERFAQKYGFAKDDTVILSGEDPLASFRLAVILRYIGVRDVRVLNGGFRAWKAAGYAIDTVHREPQKTEHWSFGAGIPMNAEWIDTYQELKSRLEKTGNFRLVDNRTWDEYIGRVSGYSYHDKRGRIPGAVFGYSGAGGSSAMDYYRNIDNTMRNAAEILHLWRESGIDPQRQHLSFMCGSGWRAAEVLIYARVMGFENTSLYSDGWIGWSNNPENPVATGLPEGGREVPVP